MSILETIDGALSGYETSRDAMRWVPKEERPDVLPADYLALAADALSRDMVRFLGTAQAIAEAIRPVVEAQARACAKFTHSIDRGLWPDRHRRCVTCHPWRRPKPLAVNGHEYQRRLKARRRRRR